MVSTVADVQSIAVERARGTVGIIAAKVSRNFNVFMRFGTNQETYACKYLVLHMD